MKQLKTILKNELRKNELVYILYECEVANSCGVMNELKPTAVLKNYKPTELVKSFWHEDGLCIILK